MTPTPATAPATAPQRRSPQRKTLGLGLLAGAIALAITNPGQPAYINYAAERLPHQLKADCGNLKRDIELGDLLSLPTGDLCQSVVQGADLVGRGVVKQLIDVSTERQNFGLLSLYTTRVPGRSFKTVAIARQFVMVYGR